VPVDGVEWGVDDVVAVVTDLYFQSRISTVAARAGRTVRYIRRLDDLNDLDGYSLALVDLDAEMDVLAAIACLATLKAPIAFGPHVDTERRKDARAAGAGRVLAKSKLVAELPSLMGVV
jgi:hypothetical protein